VLDFYRFILAVLVVQTHLLGDGLPGLGWQAVFSFYVLSGFLMTLVLNEVYGFGAQGFVRFFTNRVLRLYPAYYALLLVTILFIVFVSPANQLNGALSLPQTTYGWFANIFMIGLVGIEQGQVAAQRLSPSAWSLAIELFCYALLAAYFARSRARLVALLCVGLLATAVHFALQLRTPVPQFGFLDHYTVLQAGLIPFAVGGLAYFNRYSRWFAPGRGRIGIVGLLFVGNGALVALSQFHNFVSGLYVAVVLNLFLVPMLFRYDQAHGTRMWQETLGGIAYPLFISHWFIGTVIILLWSSLVPRGVAHFLVSLVASVAFSLGLYLAVDRNVEKLRTRFKQRPSPREEWAGDDVGSGAVLSKLRT
jgi:peptidoglycan/LPS O-acetylase OafA/YrhL